VFLKHVILIGYIKQLLIKIFFTNQIVINIKIKIKNNFFFKIFLYFVKIINKGIKNINKKNILLNIANIAEIIIF
jgi:hypothetical protein